MGNKYKRLTLHDRVRIEVLLSKRTSYADIGRILGKDRSTIKREVERYGKAIDGYDGYYAQALSENNKTACKKKKRMEEIKDMLWQYLRYGKRRRTKQHSRRSQREIIEGRVFIDQRPDGVNAREEVGHWETDTVMYGQKKGINTVVERVTRYVLLTKLRNKTAKETEEALIKKLSEHVVRTITGDNGVENKNHRHIASSLQANFYFCHPYHSWEKGSNENINGMLRRYLSKHTDLDTVTDQELEDIEYELNTRPRKILGFKSPLEVLQYHYQFVALAY